MNGTSFIHHFIYMYMHLSIYLFIHSVPLSLSLSSSCTCAIRPLLSYHIHVAKGKFQKPILEFILNSSLKNSGYDFCVMRLFVGSDFVLEF